MKKKLVILFGPSGVGKSSLIGQITKLEPRIKAVIPFTDRPKRQGEFSRRSISRKDFDQLESKAQYIIAKNIYGYRYATNKTEINSLIKKGVVPVIDFPLDRVDFLSDFKKDVCGIYIAPPSLAVLKSRLRKDGRDVDLKRFEEGKLELSKLKQMEFKHPYISAVVVNSDLEKQSKELLSIIYENTNLSKKEIL